jgi:aminoglycoside phosphotransferase (APT) family kinase protein
MSASTKWDHYFDQLAAELGGRKVSARPQVRNSGGRPAFFVDVEVGDALRKLYVRAGRDMAPPGAAYRDLEREKTVMDWLDERGILIASAVHLCREPVALAMEALEGEDDWEKIASAESGEAILSHFVEIIADMHSHDVSALAKAGFRAPAGDEEVAMHHFEDFAVRTYELSGTPRNPLCKWSQGWMRRHAPKASRRLSLVQGDCGPGNFVYEDGRVLGLVDWELAHLGDAMEDLGVLRLRDVWTPFPGGFRKWLDLYESKSGTSVDDHALRWYAIKICIVHPHVLAIPFYHPQVSATPAEWVAEYYGLSRIGLEEMAVVSGITLETPALPAPRETLQSQYFDILSTELKDEVVAKIDDDFRRYRAEQAWRIAQYLRGTERYLDAIHDEEIDEIGRITGKTVTDHEEAISALNTHVETASPDADEDLLRFFYRQQYRMEALMPGAVGRGEGRSLRALVRGEAAAGT